MNGTWKEVLGTIAPAVATLLGGPFAGLAVGALSKKLLNKEGGTVEELAPLIQQASPDTLLKIKEVEAELKLGLANAGIKLEEIAGADRASARDREVKTGDSTTKILAYVYTAGYFATLYVCMKTGVAAEMKDTVLVLLGVLTAAQTAIMGYYFGSSSGSARKNDLMAKLQA